MLIEATNEARLFDACHQSPSKIIYEQLARNWDDLYAAQVVAQTSNDWLRR